MKRNVIFVNCSYEKIIKEPVINNHYWYDSFYKKSYNFNCSSLNYKFENHYYIEDEQGNKKQLVHASQDEFQKYGSVIKQAKVLTVEPKIYEVNVKKKLSNKDSLKKLFNQWENYNNTKVDLIEENTNGIFFSVPDNELDDFTFELEKNNFRYSME
jgi:hypothetical protein